MTTPERWLLMDASCQGVLRIAMSQPGRLPLSTDIRHYDSAELPTFTDALIRFERETGAALFGATAALAVAGAVSAETISIARSRWIISRAGFTPLFGSPVAIINDVAARTWATLQGVSACERLRGTGSLNVSSPGRTALLTFDEGVGGAILNIDDFGHATVVESEVGHVDFTPASEEDELLRRSLSVAGEQPSWEQLLMATFAGKGGGGDSAAVGRLVGRFAGNATLALGAWRGVMLTGRHADRLRQPVIRQGFEAGFQMRRGFRRQLADVSCWIIQQRDPVLAGLVALLGARRADGPPPAS